MQHFNHFRFLSFDIGEVFWSNLQLVVQHFITVDISLLQSKKKTFFLHAISVKNLNEARAVDKLEIVSPRSKINFLFYLFFFLYKLEISVKQKSDLHVGDCSAIIIFYKIPDFQIDIFFIEIPTNIAANHWELNWQLSINIATQLSFYFILISFQQEEH